MGSGATKIGGYVQQITRAVRCTQTESQLPLQFFYGRDKCLSASLNEGLCLKQYDSEENADTFCFQDHEIRNDLLEVGSLYFKENYLVAERDCTGNVKISLQSNKPANWTFGVYGKIIKESYKLSIFYRIPNCSTSLWYFVTVNKYDEVVLQPYEVNYCPGPDLYCFYRHQPTI